MNIHTKSALNRLTRAEKGDSVITKNGEKDHTIKSGELAIKQAQLTGDTLHEAKDKAQLSASAAMAIVHITLLKAVLDSGSSIPYFYISVALVSWALLQQIVVGLIAIGVANVRKRYECSRQHPFEDAASNICGCRIKTKRRVQREKRIKDIVRENEDDLNLGHVNIMNECSFAKIKKQTDFDEEKGCFPGMPCCTTRIHPDYEYDILDRYDCWCAKEASTHLSVVRSLEDLERIQSSIGATKADLKTMAAETRSKAADNEISKQIKLLGKLNDDKNMALDNVLEAKILERQGKILYEYSEAVLKKRMLKFIVFWQNSINYILYSVCIFNAFIAGFGMGTPGETLSQTVTVNRTVLYRTYYVNRTFYFDRAFYVNKTFLNEHIDNQPQIIQDTENYPHILPNIGNEQQISQEIDKKPSSQQNIEQEIEQSFVDPKDTLPKAIKVNLTVGNQPLSTLAPVDQSSLEVTDQTVANTPFVAQTIQPSQPPLLEDQSHLKEPPGQEVVVKKKRPSFVKG